MDISIANDQKHITASERTLVNKQVKEELIEHLYLECLPGTIVGIPAGIAVFINFYGYTPTYPLILWYIAYNLSISALTVLYFLYRKFQQRIKLSSWFILYFIFMSICALMWGISIPLIPENLTREYLAFISLFIITTGYATGSIGSAELGITTLSIILFPLVAWCIYKGSFFYLLMAVISLLYYSFMCIITVRSTKWFKSSLVLKLENNLVSYQVNHDSLTDLPNERLLAQYIETTIQALKNTNQSFALICFSPNRINIINDSLGHQSVDVVIKSIANRLRALADSNKKITDQQNFIVSISRQDTFNILLIPITPNQLENNVKQIFSILNDPFYLEKQSITLTGSIGISIYPKDAKDAHSLVTNADAAMFKAKQFGGNRYEFYRAEITSQTPRQIELENDLHKALKNNEFTVYYQPLINIRTGEIIGMEALMRWLHPEQGFIPPLKFIPLAEETGLIVSLGKWIMEQACLQTKIWHDKGFKDLKVSVNVAERQLREGNITTIINHVLHSSKLSSNFLDLEITETAILDESIIPLIKEFKSMGLSLSIDDFGTGYSGLSYFKQFSIDKIKIDQSFIRDIPQNKDSMTIVAAIIAMTKELNVHSLAEGVETEEQLQFLTLKGCDYVQGYYFSKPVPANLFTNLLENNPYLIKQKILLEENNANVTE